MLEFDQILKRAFNMSRVYKIHTDLAYFSLTSVMSFSLLQGIEYLEQAHTTNTITRSFNETISM